MRAAACSTGANQLAASGRGSKTVTTTLGFRSCCGFWTRCAAGRNGAGARAAHRGWLVVESMLYELIMQSDIFTTRNTWPLLLAAVPPPWMVASSLGVNSRFSSVTAFGVRVFSLLAALRLMASLLHPL